MMVGMLQERGIDLHLAGEHRPESLLGLLPRRDFLWARCQLAPGWDDAEFLLAVERLFAQRVPTLVKLSLVLRDPLCRYMVRGMAGTGREIDEERLVGRHRLLLTDPADRFVGQVFRQVIALLGSPVWLDRRRSVVERRVVLVVFAADEPVEVLEA